jgi:hypothetical protein
MIEPDPIFLNCMGESIEPLPILNCDDIERFCSFQDFGEHRLSEKSRDYFITFCKPLGALLHFENLDGERVTFRVIEKDFVFKTRSLFFISSPCPADSTKTMGTCMKSEKARIRLSDDAGQYELDIELSSLGDFNRPTAEEVADFLQISRIAPRFNVDEMIVIVDQKDSFSNATASQKDYSSITLNNTTYTDVISHIFYDSAKWKYYFEKGTGLIALENGEGRIFTLVE